MISPSTGRRALAILAGEAEHNVLPDAHRCFNLPAWRDTGAFASFATEMTDWNPQPAMRQFRAIRSVAWLLLAKLPKHRLTDAFSRWFLVLAGIWTPAIGGADVSVAAETGFNVPSFLVKSWRTIDGLPQNSVLAMAQTPDGYLWVGTRGGLARFDGVRFRSHGLADGLKGLSIWSLAEDGQGGLWIGTLGGGLSHWHDGKITTWTTTDGLAHNDVMALAAAGPGAVWVGTKRGVQHYGPGGFTSVGDAEGLRREVVALATDRDGGLWITAEGSGLYFCKAGRCDLIPGPPELPQIYSYSLVVDTAGDLWICDQPERQCARLEWRRAPHGPGGPELHADRLHQACADLRRLCDRLPRLPLDLVNPPRNQRR